MEIVLMDELPRIGSGRRIVSVVVGRKWVRLATTAGRGKLLKSEWPRIERTGRILPDRIKRRKRK